MATDPICGMYVNETSTSLIRKNHGRKYYFCSTNCLIQFERPEKELSDLKIELAISWPLTVIVLILTYLIRFSVSNYVMLVLAAVVQFYTGARFYKGTLDALKNRSANMDTLIAMGTSTAFLYSAVVVLFPNILPSNSLYFDTSTLIISLILTGTFMQHFTEKRASDAIEKLVSLQPGIAHLVKGNKIIDIPIEKVKVGDIILVKPGETVPTDSIVIEGHSSINESMITGESMPISKHVKDNLIGGTINLSGALRVKVEKIGSDTTLAKIIDAVEGAASSKVPIQKLADKISSYFVPAVIMIAIISSLLWYYLGNVGLQASVLIFVSVLIIACPCALGIATPAALLVSTGKAAKQGILVKSGENIQMASKIDTIAFDKTGTITKGKPEVTDIVSVGEYSKNKLLLYASQAEINSEHVLGKAIIEKARNIGISIKFPKKFKYIQGKGISSVSSDGKKLLIGNRDLFASYKISDKTSSRIEGLESKGKTVLILGIGENIEGLIALADVVREDSKDAITVLRNMNIDTWLISGDSERVAKAIGKEVGITNIMANVKPGEKLNKISEIQKQGRKIAMVGDGINDAPALEKADLGIAIGSGTDIAIEVGGIILIRNRLTDVVTVIDLGKKTMKKIKENLFWAFAYNIILIPVAAGALIPFFGIGIYDVLPILAAVAMSISSITVVSNSLLLNLYGSN